MFCARRPAFLSCSTSSSALAPWSGVLLRAVVRRSSQGHADGLLFVSPPRAQSSPSTSLSSCSDGLPAGHHRKGHTTPQMKVTQGATWLVVVVVCVVQMINGDGVSVQARS